MKKSERIIISIGVFIIALAAFNTWAINNYGNVLLGKIDNVNISGKLYLVKYLNINSEVCYCKIKGRPNEWQIGDEIKIKVHPFFSSICRRQ